MAWDIETSRQVTEWLEELDDPSFDQIMPAIDALAEVGPTLGRPLADRVKASRHHNVPLADALYDRRLAGERV